MQRWQWSPADYQASLKVVPGHIRRRQRRKARPAGLTDEADTSSGEDEPPSIITINDEVVYRKYNWDTDELYVPG